MPLTNFQRYHRIAPFYDLLDRPFEGRRYRPLRPLLFQGLSGRILDAGVGTGRNFPFYPREATVVGIDISPAMLAQAERRLNEAAAPVELLGMDVTRPISPTARSTRRSGPFCCACCPMSCRYRVLACPAVSGIPV